MYTVAALVVSYGTTRLLSNSPAIHIAEVSPQINYDTSQLYHGVLMGMKGRTSLTPDGTITTPLRSHVQL